MGSSQGKSQFSRVTFSILTRNSAFKSSPLADATSMRLYQRSIQLRVSRIGAASIRRRGKSQSCLKKITALMLRYMPMN